MKEDINMESNENYIEINFPYSSKLSSMDYPV